MPSASADIFLSKPDKISVLGDIVAKLYPITKAKSLIF
jgi:hypothetical protein